MVKILLLCVVLLSGCHTTPKYPEIVTVEVPVFYCPQPVDIEKPELYIFGLSDEDAKNPDKVFKAYAASIKQLENYATLLNLQFELYKGFIK